MDMFPSTDSVKNAVDMFPRTDIIKWHSFYPLKPRWNSGHDVKIICHLAADQITRSLTCSRVWLIGSNPPPL